VFLSDQRASRHHTALADVCDWDRPFGLDPGSAGEEEVTGLCERERWHYTFVLSVALIAWIRGILDGMDSLSLQPDRAGEHHGRPLPPEFRGLARLFRTKMSDAAEKSGKVLQKIGADTFAEYDRRNRRHNFGLREDALRDIEIRWRAIPSFGGISQTVTRDRRSIVATDTRIRPEKVVGSNWEDPGTEQSLCVVRCGLTVNKHRAETTHRTLVTLSLRALGRWFQRSWTPTDEALLSDIAMLASHATPAMLDSPGRFSVPSDHATAWLGTVADFCDIYGTRAPALNVRTFW
jgi:hypothetical protein